MKSNILLSLCFVFAAMLFTPVQAHETVADLGLHLKNPPRWEKLGQRRVNYGLDRDEIRVTAREGRFTSLRLKAELAPINLHRCVVHFANGTTKSFNIAGGDLRAGQITRNLDLPGNRRVITKVVFWYDTKSRARTRGRIELWGRR